jgi:hypothetical protein
LKPLQQQKGAGQQTHKDFSACESDQNHIMHMTTIHKIS